MSFKPGVEPGIVVALPDRQTLVIPGYRVQSNGVAFDVGISCKADLTDDFHEFIYSDDYQGRCIDLRSIVYHNRLFGSNNKPKLGYKIDVRD